MCFCLMFRWIFLRKSKGFPSKTYFLQMSRERTRACSKIWYIRYELVARCIFSFPSRRRDVLYLPASTSTTRATNMSGVFCEVHHHFGGSLVSLMYVYLLNLYSTSFICPPKYRCSFVADIRTRVSAHSQIA